MFNDIALNKEFVEGFQVEGEGFTLEPLVLTAGNWPNVSASKDKANIQDDKTKFPEFLLKRLKDFENHYNKTNKGRTLNWILNEGGAQINMFSNGKTYKLDIKGHWVPILLLFNTNKSYTLKDLQEKTEMKKETLEQYLEHLVGKKIFVLKSAVTIQITFIIMRSLNFQGFCPKAKVFI